MDSIVTDVADITILGLIDNTTTAAAGSGPIGATVVIADKGPVGIPTKVTAETWQNVFGKPLHPGDTGAEGLRHVNDAAKECAAINVVRCTHSDARFPSLEIPTALAALSAVAGTVNPTANTIALVDSYWAPVSSVQPPGLTFFGKVSVSGPGVLPTGLLVDTLYAFVQLSAGLWRVYLPNTNTPIDITTTGTTPITVTATDIPLTASAHSYGTSISLGAGVLAIVYPIDGDPSTNRTLILSPILGSANQFTITITDVDIDGTTYVLETYTASCNKGAKDDLGLSAFLPTVLENNSPRFRAIVDPSISDTVAMAAISIATPTSFTGGTNGDNTAITPAELITAWDIFRNESFAANVLIGAGESDLTVLANIGAIADFRHIACGIDVPSGLSPSAALTWLTGRGLHSRHMAASYCPFMANDPFTGGKSVWGASGAYAAATARCFNIQNGTVPGVHYAPAGSTRGYLDRTGVQALFVEVLDRQAAVTARMNPVVIGPGGQLVFDDCLTLNPKNNYSRFAWVNNIFDYVDHQFLAMASSLKFEPDAITESGLTSGITSILDGLVTSGALRPPRNPAVDGTEPYRVTIVQLELDLWRVVWELCPSGAARRIVGQPMTIK